MVSVDKNSVSLAQFDYQLDTLQPDKIMKATRYINKLQGCI